MKIKNPWAPSLALGVLLATPQVTPLLQAQSAGAQDQQKAQTFVGKIVKARNGQYALLTDEQAGKGAFLDDQEKAKEFEGKNVKVTGTLEAARSLIHVSNIELA